MDIHATHEMTMKVQFSDILMDLKNKASGVLFELDLSYYDNEDAMIRRPRQDVVKSAPDRSQQRFMSRLKCALQVGSVRNLAHIC